MRSICARPGVPPLLLVVSLACVVAAAVVAAPRATAAGRQNALVGAWTPETYVLSDGPTHRVEGKIFFTGRDWTVLFFVVDEEGRPRRGSAEGGTYTLDGERLTFTHLYNASGGEAVDGLAAQGWTMRIAGRAEAATEPCRIEIAGDRLTIHFPSGNHMTFTRSS